MDIPAYLPENFEELTLDDAIAQEKGYGTLDIKIEILLIPIIILLSIFFIRKRFCKNKKVLFVIYGFLMFIHLLFFTATIIINNIYIPPYIPNILFITYVLIIIISIVSIIIEAVFNRKGKQNEYN